MQLQHAQGGNTLLLSSRNTLGGKCLPLRSHTKYLAAKGKSLQLNHLKYAPGLVHVAKPTVEAILEEPPEQYSPRQSGILAPAFHSLGVDPACLPGLVKMGIVEPSPIQRNAVQQIISGANVAVQSYTGSGKTLAYLLPAITLALKRAETVARTTGGEVPVQVLVAAPNQELAMQIVRVAQSVLPDAARKMVQQCIGGANINNQTADQLLAPHFTEDMYAITTKTGKRLGEEAARAAAAEGDGETHLQKEGEGSAVHAESRAKAPEELRASRQTVLASATLTESVLAKTAAWCPSPLYITAGGPAPVLDPAGAPQSNAHAVFNAELPSSAAHYAHRAGRTGRMGAPGSVITLVTPSDVWVVDKLARRLGVPIQEVHVADGRLHQGPPPRKPSTPEEAKSSRAVRSRTGSPSPSSPAPEGNIASATSIDVPSTSTSNPEAEVSPSKKKQPAAAAAATKQGNVSTESTNSSSSRKSAVRGSGLQSHEQKDGSEEVGVIVDDEDEWEVDEDDEGWEGSQASSSGRGSRVQGSISRSGRRDTQEAGLPVPGSRAARRALKFGRGKEANSGEGDGHISKEEGRRLAANEGVGSKMKEDLMRELMALREEKAAVKGMNAAGSRRKGAKASTGNM
ncbi:hypothetical protein DUNSADRAFT_4250 [Dunaliella salina]|uniref:Uncharacterized protein n=1 Tax=Dunaliella salina TaxID=3046 RepID=A0ABQ7GSA5_DUNSA|nr:hypothetical protein DUNSADRAFT_4250 [Dunaliella salina]|eukprot:KAF5837503.1 hypothetical protein DUNSADRAFT_4250 [Dunaliella salina]